MDDAPGLISNVTFTEKKRGYDPEEVHGYLLEVEDQVGTLKEMARGAIERAEAAEARVAEARRSAQAIEERVAVAERRAAEAEARAAQAAEAPADPSAEAAGILAMAQRTADAAVAEAEERSRAVEADAATRAAEVVTEAEQRATERLAEARSRAEAMVEEARAEADAVRDREMGALRAELDELEQARGDLQRDVDLLGGFLERRRAMLRETLDQLAAVIDEPDRLRLGAAPTLSGTEVPPPAPTAEEGPTGDGDAGAPQGEGTSAGADEARSQAGPSGEEPVAVPLGGAPDEDEPRGATAPEGRGGEGGEPDDATPAGRGRDDHDARDRGDLDEDDVDEDELDDDELEDDELVDEELDADEDEDDELDADELEGEELDVDEGEHDEEDRGSGNLAEKPPWYAEDRPEGGPGRRGPSRPPAVPVVTVEDLDGPATQAVPVAELFGEDEGAELDAAAARAERLALFPEEGNDSSFGRLDEEEDAAMRAFFESDPEGGEGRSRWGFGRKR